MATKKDKKLSNSEIIESKFGIRLAKIICGTILGLMALIGIFFGKEGLIAIGIFIIIGTLFMIFTVNDSY